MVVVVAAAAAARQRRGKNESEVYGGPEHWG